LTLLARRNADCADMVIASESAPCASVGVLETRTKKKRRAEAFFCGTQVPWYR
jgi:hypothetical protein